MLSLELANHIREEILQSADSDRRISQRNGVSKKTVGQIRNGQWFLRWQQRSKPMTSSNSLRSEIDSAIVRCRCGRLVRANTLIDEICIACHVIKKSKRNPRG